MLSCPVLLDNHGILSPLLADKLVDGEIREGVIQLDDDQSGPGVLVSNVPITT
ncbi:hypothetical protein [Porphyromonas sp.]|uniref:hypothetical protein n=1 Tax=Porphyromonas sp. TaxID=1924944 RepID=UPI00257AFEE0|nr:hypothetical protein [Porphyromonas sp.]